MQNSNKEKNEDIQRDDEDITTGQEIDGENNESSEKDDEESSLDSLEIQLEKYKKEAEEMTDLAQRTKAEFANYKRRTGEEKEKLFSLANEKIVTELLEVVDNFERALDAVEDKDSDFYKGVDLIRKQLIDILSKFGLSEIDALGADFDPNFHHAVAKGEGEESNKVIEVFQKGYTLSDKVIRASMVKVSE